jgi:hypothetical protein
MTQVLDLSDLDALDLQSLRLGAQVMEHKAELAAHPRVEFFFKGLQLTVDEELARRKSVPDDKPLVTLDALPLPPAGAGIAPAATPSQEDRRLAAEYLDLLEANDRLSVPVRLACRTLREHLGPDY